MSTSQFGQSNTDVALHGGHAAYHDHGPQRAPTARERPTTPVLYVPGNGRDATDFDPIAHALLDQGYHPDDLWAVTFAQSTPTHAEMAAQLDRCAEAILSYLGCDQLDVISHSLGVTGARYWINTHERYDTVNTFIGLAGANHGLDICCLADDFGLTTGRFRIAHTLRSDYQQIPGHPLADLNANPTPEPISWYTLHGTQDLLFAMNPESPRLAGATNATIETGHHGVRLNEDAHALICDWLTTTE